MKRIITALISLALMVCVSHPVIAEDATLGNIDENDGFRSVNVYNAHPETFTSGLKGCGIHLRSYTISEDMWYVIESAADEALDPKLYYKYNGSYHLLHDDINYPSNANFRAVVHTRQRYATYELQLAYHQGTPAELYWTSIKAYDYDPGLTGVPYLEAYNNGTMEVIQH